MGSIPTAPIMDIKEALETVLNEAEQHLWNWGMVPLKSDDNAAIAFRKVKSWLEEDFDDMIYPNG